MPPRQTLAAIFFNLCFALIWFLFYLLLLHYEDSTPFAVVYRHQSNFLLTAFALLPLCFAFATADEDLTLLALKICTDIAKITRKRSKPDKHGHGNGKSVQEPGVSIK
ncbi:hypothetical protein Tco_1433290, partial [Tanacetum coccineum]